MIVVAAALELRVAVWSIVADGCQATHDSALTRNHHHLFDRNVSILQRTVDAAEAFRHSYCFASAAALHGSSGLTASCSTSPGLVRSGMSRVKNSFCG